MTATTLQEHSQFLQKSDRQKPTVCCRLWNGKRHLQIKKLFSEPYFAQKKMSEVLLIFISVWNPLRPERVDESCSREWKVGNNLRKFVQTLQSDCRLQNKVRGCFDHRSLFWALLSFPHSSFNHPKTSLINWFVHAPSTLDATRDAKQHLKRTSLLQQQSCTHCTCEAMCTIRTRLHFVASRFASSVAEASRNIQIQVQRHHKEHAGRSDEEAGRCSERSAAAFPARRNPVRPGSEQRSSCITSTNKTKKIAKKSSDPSAPSTQDGSNVDPSSMGSDHTTCKNYNRICTFAHMKIYRFTCVNGASF